MFEAQKTEIFTLIEKAAKTADSVQALQFSQAACNAANAILSVQVFAQHKSDCAIHNAPALPAGACDCGAA